MTIRRKIELTINGTPCVAEVEPRQHLADFLRERGGLPSVRVSCEYGVCGCCTILVDGETARACLMLAVQADGREIVTLEGLAENHRLEDLQRRFVSLNALQCGYCTPAMLIAADELLRRERAPSRERIREHLSGNYCRCTGYHAIVEAVYEVGQERAEREAR